MPRFAIVGMLGALAALGLAPQSAHATACCAVSRTPDGFLAMRTGPGPNFPMIIKIPSGKGVCFGSRDPKQPKTGNWEYGSYTDGQNQTYRGWVNTRYLQRDCG
jgi:uncharacterized protein YraI